MRAPSRACRRTPPCICSGLGQRAFDAQAAKAGVSRGRGAAQLRATLGYSTSGWRSVPLDTAARPCHRPSFRLPLEPLRQRRRRPPGPGWHPRSVQILNFAEAPSRPLPRRATPNSSSTATLGARRHRRKHLISQFQGDSSSTATPRDAGASGVGDPATVTDCSPSSRREGDWQRLDAEIGRRACTRSPVGRSGC